MIISRRKQPSLPGTPLKQQPYMERVHSYKYLGVWLTSTLNWSLQVSKICKKARQQVGVLYQRFYLSANTSSLLQLYLAYICPHLEHAASVWDPYQQGLINSLERVQKFALGVHQKLEFQIQVFTSVMQPAHPCQQKTLSETVPTLPNCQWTSEFPYSTHCYTKPIHIPQKHPLKGH